MRSLSRMIELFKAQLSGFSLAAKALIGALLAVMVLTLLLVAQLTGRQQLAPIGLSAASEDARVRAATYLEQMRVPYEARAGDLWVPAEQRYRVMGAMQANELLAPEQIDFQTLLSDPSPFTDRETKRQQYHVAMTNKVEKMIRNMSDVFDVSVIIGSPSRPNGLGAARIEPTASVEVMPAGPALSHELANTIARMVAGAYPALDVANVTVVDRRTGASIAGVSQDTLMASTALQSRKQAEAYVEEKIREHLADIPDLRVAVAVELDNRRTVGRRTMVDKPVSGVTRERSRESSSENTYTPREPGVRANVGGSMDLRTARASRREESETEAEFEPVYPNRQEEFEDPGGRFELVNVSLRVPRSYLVQLWRFQTGAAADEDPAETDLEPIRAARLADVQESVRTLVDTTAVVEGAVAGTVTVVEYDDRPVRAAGGVAGGGASGRNAGVVGMLVSEGLISTVAVVLLGAMSLGLMFMMVRKATREEELPSAEELVGIPPALAEAEDDLVGEAEETDAAMEGMEIDEDTVRRAQMLEQINDLAVQDPEEAASLIRKWIRADEAT